eukprot:3754082-Pleurochrysis_carterae.AAC.5
MAVINGLDVPGLKSLRSLRALRLIKMFRLLRTPRVFQVKREKGRGDGGDLKSEWGSGVTVDRHAVAACVAGGVGCGVGRGGWRSVPTGPRKALASSANLATPASSRSYFARASVKMQNGIALQRRFHKLSEFLVAKLGRRLPLRWPAR